jgi:hypothetical protein
VNIALFLAVVQDPEVQRGEQCSVPSVNANKKLFFHLLKRREVTLTGGGQAVASLVQKIA